MLLSVGYLQNSEFMELMTSTAATARYYDDLVHTWQTNQRFMKKVSDVSTRHKFAESVLDELAAGFSDQSHDDDDALANFLTPLHFCSSSSLTRIDIETQTSLLRKAKQAMDQAVPGLQACIRAQKARRLSKIRAIAVSESQETFPPPRNTFANQDGTHGSDKPPEDRDGEEAKFQVNKCRVCLKTFHNRYQLIKHQNTHGHKLKRGRPTISPE